MKPFVWMALATACLAASCQQQYRKQESPVDEVQQSPLPKQKTATDDAGVATGIPAVQRKLAHTSQVNFEVAATLPATRQIEEQVHKSGGFILQSRITMQDQDMMSPPAGTDSVKKTTYYRLQNSMVVRVPDSALSRFLNFVDELSGFTVSRSIEAEDLSLSLTANQLETARLGRQLNRRTGTKKTDSGYLPIPASLEEKEVQRDSARMNYLHMNDAVQFSTVTLNFTQPPQVLVQSEINKEAIWARQPRLGTRMADAFTEGRELLTDLLVFIVRIWWLIVLVIAGMFLYRKWGRPLIPLRQTSTGK